MKLKDYLIGKVSKNKLHLIPSSYDIIGDILIFNSFPKELKKEEKLVGNAALKLFKNIKVVAVKSRKFSGRLRTQRIRIIAGIKRKATIHKENNVLIRLDVEKCYFSPRLSAERLRIAKQVKPDEVILVAFSGVSPYSLVIARNSGVKEVYAIELNKIAHKYAMENVKLNKLSNIHLYNGDVKKILPKLNQKFDRILLPLPKTSENYLQLVKKYVKKNGVIHYYTFLDEKRIKAAKVPGFKILRKTICGHYSPRVYRVCFDLKVG